MSNLDWFWELTDDEIREAIETRAVMYNSRNEAHKRTFQIAWRYGFQSMSTWFYDCNGDRVLMRLRYADEIAKLEKELTKPQSPGVSVTVYD